MSEAIIARGGRKGGGSGSDFHGLMTEVYTSSTIWLVPSNAVNNEFSVRIFGGGGGGSPGGGGGGGWMNNDTLTLEPGTLIFINIGSGGESVEDTSYSGTQHPFWATSGGITSFGTYLSASGGSAPTIPNNDYADESWYNGTGGSGGAGGGGRLHGGRGYQFGGGGGSLRNGSGGHGGPWGGGGGGNTIGQGGTYGGNGGNTSVGAENGTNTVGWTNVGQELNGSYITGNGITTFWYTGGGGGGGGGFGGKGGYGATSISDYGGGGGGYGADGGNGYYSSGGGGGYGKGGYGGTYGITLWFNAPGGGGSYGRGGSLGKEGPLFGGGGSAGQDGADGICIIQYYVS